MRVVVSPRLFHVVSAAPVSSGRKHHFPCVSPFCRLQSAQWQTAPAQAFLRVTAFFRNSPLLQYEVLHGLQMGFCPAIELPKHWLFHSWPETSLTWSWRNILKILTGAAAIAYSLTIKILSDTNPRKFGKLWLYSKVIQITRKLYMRNNSLLTVIQMEAHTAWWDYRERGQLGGGSSESLRLLSPGKVFS